MALPNALPAEGRPTGTVSIRARIGRRLASRSGDGVDAVLSFAVRVGGALFTFLSQVLIARWMGLSEFGAFSNAWVWIVLVGTLTQAGFASSTTRLACGYLETGDRQRLKGIVIYSQLAVLGLSIAVMLVVALLARLPSIAFSASQREAMLIGCLCIPVFAQIDIGKGLARVEGLAWLAYLPAFLLRPVLFFLAVGAAHFAGFGVDAPIAIWAMLAALGLTWLIQRGILARRVAPLVKGQRAKWEPGPWLTGSLPIMAVDGYFLFVASIDVMLLNALTSPEQGGAYFAASRTTTLISYVSFAVSAISSARMARLHAAGDIDGLEALAHKFSHWTFWPTLAAAIMLLISGPLVLDLFGEGFREAYPVMAILALGLVVQAGAGPVKFLMLMTGLHTQLASLLCVSAVLCTGLNLALIPPFGAYGAAIATTATMVLTTLGTAVLVRRRLGLWSVVGARPVARAMPVVGSL